MTDVYLAGTAMTRFGRHLDRSLKSLTHEAVNGALVDAGCQVDQVGAAFFGNCVQGHMEGQSMIRGQIALRDAGFQGIPIFNVENACATASTAFHLAVNYLRSGMADIVLAVGAEKMFSTDRERMFAAFDGAWDVHEVESSKATLLAMGEGVEVPPGSMSDKPYSVFMDIYAAISRLHMKTYGSTIEEFAAVAAKNHMHSVSNELAQYRVPYTVEEVLKAPPIAYPLTLPMCSPISDGAAAAILCTPAGLKRLAGARAEPLRVRASVLRSGAERAPADYERHVSRLAADAAYKQAGLNPQDMDVAEVHDASAVGEVAELEALRLVAPGQGGKAAVRGETALGGSIPVNPSGGLESKGHPIGATGLGQIHELALQLRGLAASRQVQGANAAIAQNGGGIIGVEEAVTAVTILSR